MAGGYGILPKSNVRSELLLVYLNSRVLDFFHHKVASQMHGGWFSYESRFIRNLPIRPLNLRDSTERTQHDAIVRLVEWLLWLHRQPSVAESTREHPRDPLIASYFEQWINALVYELYFPQEIATAGLRFFALTAEHSLPPLAEWREKDERLPKIRGPGSRARCIRSNWASRPRSPAPRRRSVNRWSRCRAAPAF